MAPLFEDVLEAGLEEHHYLHPVRADATPVWNEEVTASTEIAPYRRFIGMRCFRRLV